MGVYDLVTDSSGMTGALLIDTASECHYAERERERERERVRVSEVMIGHTHHALVVIQEGGQAH